MKLGPEGTRGEGDIMVLAGEGPHAPVAARRAGEFVAATGGAGSLTLYNVQVPNGDEDDLPPEERGASIIENVVERAGIEYMNYETRVDVGDDPEKAILEAVEGYDTICVGATRWGAISQALFGSLPETVGEQVSGTVVMARGTEKSPMSIRQALIRRLEG